MLLLLFKKNLNASKPSELFVVVDSHIQRIIVLATEKTTVTQQVSHRPIKCQSRLWSQRGTKVNESHRGANPLLKPTGIQIATKSYATLQAMVPTNVQTVHQPCLLYIESNLDRLGFSAISESTVVGGSQSIGISNDPLIYTINSSELRNFKRRRPVICT